MFSRPKRIKTEPVSCSWSAAAGIPNGTSRRYWRRLFVSLLILAAAYAWISYCYWTNPPKIRRNFTAEINAEIDSIPKHERAWPRYRKALLAIQEPDWHEHNIGPVPWAARYLEENPEGWQQALRFVELHRAQLKEVREAAKLPSLALHISDGVKPDDAPLFGEHPSTDSPMVITWLLPEVRSLLRLSFYLTIDFRRSVQRQDSNLAMANLLAVIGIAEHMCQRPTLVNDMISMKMFSCCMSEICESRIWELLSESQLSELKDSIANYKSGEIIVEVGLERMTFEDAIQRLYTDDGSGDGYLFLPAVDGFARGDTSKSDLNLWDRIIAPILSFTLKDRRRVTKAFDSIMDRAEHEVRQPPWEYSKWSVGQEMAPYVDDKHFVYLTLLFPDLDRPYVTSQIATQLRNAAIVSILLEQYRRKRGANPSSLNDLVPDFIARVPVDLLDGQSLRYRFDDGQPTIYSVGFDGDDDGGLADHARFELDAFIDEWVNSMRAANHLAPDGDWILARH